MMTEATRRVRALVVLALGSGACGHSSAPAVAAAAGAVAAVATETVVKAAIDKRVAPVEAPTPDTPPSFIARPARLLINHPPSAPAMVVSCGAQRSYKLVCASGSRDCAYQTSDGHLFACGAFCGSYVPEPLDEWCSGQ